MAGVRVLGTEDLKVKDPTDRPLWTREPFRASSLLSPYSELDIAGHEHVHVWICNKRPDNECAGDRGSEHQWSLCTLFLIFNPAGDCGVPHAARALRVTKPAAFCPGCLQRAMFTSSPLTDGSGLGIGRPLDGWCD